MDSLICIGKPVRVSGHFPAAMSSPLPVQLPAAALARQSTRPKSASTAGSSRTGAALTVSSHMSELDERVNNLMITLIEDGSTKKGRLKGKKMSLQDALGQDHEALSVGTRSSRPQSARAGSTTAEASRGRPQSARAGTTNYEASHVDQASVDLGHSAQKILGKMGLGQLDQSALNESPTGSASRQSRPHSARIGKTNPEDPRVEQHKKITSEAIHEDHYTGPESSRGSTGQSSRPQSARFGKTTSEASTCLSSRPQSARFGMRTADAPNLDRVSEQHETVASEAVRVDPSAMSESSWGSTGRPSRPQSARVGKMPSDSHVEKSVVSGAMGRHRPQSAHAGSSQGQQVRPQSAGAGSEYPCSEICSLSPTEKIETEAFLSRLLAARLAESDARRAITQRVNNASPLHNTGFPGSLSGNVQSVASHDSGSRSSKNGSNACPDSEHVPLCERRTPKQERPASTRCSSDGDCQHNNQYSATNCASSTSRDSSHRPVDTESEFVKKHRLPPEWLASRLSSAISTCDEDSTCYSSEGGSSYASGSDYPRSRHKSARIRKGPSVRDAKSNRSTAAGGERNEAPPLWHLQTGPERARFGRHKKPPKFGDFNYATGTWVNRIASRSVQNYRSYGPLWTIEDK